MKRLCIASLLVIGMLVAEDAWAQVRVVVRNAPPRRVVYVAPRPVPLSRVVVVQSAPPVRYAYVQPAPVVVVRKPRHHHRHYARRW